MPKRNPNKLFMSGRVRREMLKAFLAEDWAEFSRLKDLWLTRHKRLPALLRFNLRNPAGHSAMQTAHGSGRGFQLDPDFMTGKQSKKRRNGRLKGYESPIARRNRLRAARGERLKKKRLAKEVACGR